MTAKENSVLVHLGKARREVELASTVPELKDIRDKAEALRTYAKQAGESLAVQNHCAEIKLRAERRAGVLLREMAERGERDMRGGDRKSMFHDGTLIQKPPTLPELGIEDRKQSHRWQREAAVPDEEFEAFVAATNEKGAELTSAALLKKAKEIEKDESREETQKRNTTVQRSKRLKNLKAGFGQYATVYIDPPWAYDDRGCSGAAEGQYSTLSVDDIAALPVQKLLQDAAHVWIWTTWPMIREGSAHRVVEAWGLTWRGEIVWDKDRMLLGRWLRVQSEVLILATRGKTQRGCNDLRGMHRQKSDEHSAKPTYFYEAIERFSPGPYLELFARVARKGWDRWGNQA